MRTELSIVIPCYNCEKTLRQAVDSCYVQDIPAQSFEILLVDDGSTDRTKELISLLAKERQNIRTIFHEVNRGGGAARNTGIRNASGDLVYCLDSDNIFAPRSLGTLVSMIKSEGLDGAAFHERRFFSGSIRRFSSHINPVTGRDVTLADLFEPEAVLLDNFMFTKASFDRTAGYPEHHGFDTQCFEMRFIAAGNRVRVCPKSVFYHRQASKDASYFEREYVAGNFSLNYYLCIEDIFGTLTKEAQAAILGFDIFKRASLEDNLLLMLKSLHKNDVLLRKDGLARDPVSPFESGLAAYRSGKPADALGIFTGIISRGDASKILYYNAMRCLVALSGIGRARIEHETSRLLPGLVTERRRLYRFYHRIPVVNRIISFLRA